MCFTENWFGVAHFDSLALVHLLFKFFQMLILYLLCEITFASAPPPQRR